MRIHRTKILTTIFIASILLTACAQHAQQIRGAQDSFSRGAELELARKFGSLGEGVKNPTEEAERYYAVALGLTNEAINDDAADLKRDSLYGTALTIKALAAWRLGDLKTSKMAAKEVMKITPTKDGKNRVWPRDLGICYSLVTLAKIDALAERARNFENTLDNEKKGDTLKKILNDGKQAQKDLATAASNSVLNHHPFQLYLAQAHCELAYVLLVATKAGTVLPAEMKTEAKKEYMNFRTEALNRLDKMHQDTKMGLSQELTKKVKTYYSCLLEELN